MKCPVCKKNIPQEAVKCPYCKSRTGIVCSHCSSINPIGSLTCKNCNKELLKICSHCHSVNFPAAVKCRKCGSPFPKEQNKSKNELTFKPKLHNTKQAFNILYDGLLSKDKKIFSITGEKGIGKTTLLNKVLNSLPKNKYRICLGKCTQLTQLTPGGVIQDMLLNLFELPNYCINNEELNSKAFKFFSNEFKFLNNKEINDFINFIYNSKDGHYEDIIINKHYTCSILSKIFDAICDTGKFIFVVDNFDFIDGFSIEFITNFIKRKENQKNLKFIVIYNEHKPINAYFSIDKGNDSKFYLDIHLAHCQNDELEKWIETSDRVGAYVSKREKDVIFNYCAGNAAFVEQAISYCFDCQFADKAFLMPKSFTQLIKERIETLKKINFEAYKILSAAAILGNKINLTLLKEIFDYKANEFNDIIAYLEKSKFIKQFNEIHYEFNNLLLWETILKELQKDNDFEDINVKAGKALSIYNINTNAVMAMISHNLKENRFAFDIWTKITRLAAYIGDINLYVIAQKQCLALLNEFNENETLSIRYNISERLGKLLTEFDPQEAIEYLPDAISHAKTQNNEIKEIELLGYLSSCCKKTGNYYGDIECTDNILKKLTQSQELEIALVKASKIPSILSIGNCGQAINLIDNEILPVLNSTLFKPALNKQISLGLVYETKIKINLYLATALALQGNDRAFEILVGIFDTFEKHKITEKGILSRAKLVLAYANTMKGNFQTSSEILKSLLTSWGGDIIDIDNLDNIGSNCINNYNLINLINKLLQNEYTEIREELYDSSLFAQDTGSEIHKNIFKTFLGKVICDAQQAKKAIKIYNEQITYFSNQKLAFGALLCWYFIAQASIKAENINNAIDVAQRALEIAQNPQINNLFFIVLLKIVLAKAYIHRSDFESAKINFESALIIAKKYNMNDLISKIYYNYGKYYQEMGTIPSQQQTEYLKAAINMFDKALDIVLKQTQNNYMKELIETNKKTLQTYCQTNGYHL